MTGVRLALFNGAPEDCLWGGGRVEMGEAEPGEVLALTQEPTAWISARLVLQQFPAQRRASCG